MVSDGEAQLEEDLFILLIPGADNLVGSRILDLFFGFREGNLGGVGLGITAHVGVGVQLDIIAQGRDGFPIVGVDEGEELFFGVAWWRVDCF